MSSPWVPKTKRTEAAAPPSPTSSPETVVAEPPKYSRYPNAAFGDRLANARNLHHTEAPPPPPPRSLGSSADKGVKLGRSTTPAVLSAASAVVHGLPPQRGLRFGGEKGSYMSPYDYNIPGRAMGALRVPTTQPQPGTLSGLGAQPVGEKSSSEAMRSGAMSPVNTTESVVTMPESVVVQPPADAKERLVLLGPLRMVRQKCIGVPDLDLLANFIDTKMTDKLHTIVERDPIIPGVVYMVSIPMTDEHWEMYNQVLSRCDRAMEVHQMLAGGKDEFDHWSGSTDPRLTLQQRGAHTFLASGASTGRGLEESMVELVDAYRGMWMTSGSGYVKDMEG